MSSFRKQSPSYASDGEGSRTEKRINQIEPLMIRTLECMGVQLG